MRLISRFGGMPLPARLPVSTTYDNFLWEYLEIEVNKLEPRALEALKDAIQLETGRIPQQMLGRVMLNLKKPATTMHQQ